MSDSEFEDLTSSVHSSHLFQQLKEKNHVISELSAQVNGLRQTILTMKKVESYLRDQLLQKDDQIKKITGDSVRLSRKIIQKQEQCIRLEEQVIETEKSYHKALQQTLIHKSQLIQINSELSCKVLTSQETVQSILMEMNKSQSIRKEMSQSLIQTVRRSDEFQKRIEILATENCDVRQRLAIKDREIEQIMVMKRNEIEQALVQREEQARQERLVLEDEKKKALLKLLSLEDKLTSIQKQNSQLREQNRLMESEKNILNKQIEQAIASLDQQKLTTKELQKRNCHYMQQHQKQCNFIEQLMKKQQQLNRINSDLRDHNKWLTQQSINLQLKQEQTTKRNNQLVSQLSSKQSELLSLQITLQTLTVQAQQLRIKEHEMEERIKQQEIYGNSNKSQEQQVTQLRRKTQKLQYQLKQYEQIIHVIEQDSENYRKQLKLLETINHQSINKCSDLQDSLHNKQNQLHQLLKHYENSLQQSQSILKKQYKPQCSEQFVLTKIKELVKEIEINIALCNLQEEDRTLIEKDQKQKLLNSINSILLPTQNQNKEENKPQPKTCKNLPINAKNQPTNARHIKNISKYFKSQNPFE